MSDSLKEIVVGTLSQISALTINADTLYQITDYPVGGITNAYMLRALTPTENAFFISGETYMCTDNGTYKQGCIYKFTGTSWELLLDANLTVNDDSAETSVIVNAVGNTDDSYSATDITSIAVVIPSSFNHGDSYGLNFKTGDPAPVFSVVNQTSLPFKYIIFGSPVDNFNPKANGTVSTIFINNGLNILCYVNEV